MPLDAQQREDLAQAIAGHIPPFILAEVMAHLHPALDLAELRARGPSAPDENSQFVARQIVATLDGLNLSRSLARALYRKALLDDDFVGKIVPFMEDAGAAQQGAIAVRANTLSSRELRTFLDGTEPKLCVVAAMQADGGCKQGTGFLVGADMVLTAHHVLAEHIAYKVQGLQHPGRVRLFFDHYDGDPIADAASAQHKARPVDLHQDWLIAFSDALPRDGLLKPEEEPGLADAAKASLDFALIRLAEKIGSETRSSAGGEPRSWIDLGALGNSPRTDERIIIPQHPHGHPQRIDFGRLSSILTERDPSGTRIRYNTETEKGTSGAPCFNRNFEPVGLHNASYEPHGETVANQAIRLERIVELIDNHLPPAAAPSQKTSIWKVQPLKGTARGLFGRETFLNWLDAAAAEVSTRAGRIYAALGPVRRSGKTFSIDIMREARRHASDRIVVLGTDEGLIPEDISDVVRAIVGELRIPQDELGSMPPRPSSALPEGAADGDKLAKWISEDLPAWFDGLLQKNREFRVDPGEEARALVELLEKQDFPVPDEVRREAADMRPRTAVRSRWDRIWIALDRLGEEKKLSAEVKDFLVALMGGNLEERAVAPELRRIRWLLLGDTLGHSEANATIEQLDALSIGWPELAVCVKHLFMSLGTELRDDQLRVLEPFFRLALRDNEVTEFSAADTRLQTLQNLFARVEPEVREVFR